MIDALHLFSHLLYIAPTVKDAKCVDMVKYTHPVVRIAGIHRDTVFVFDLDDFLTHRLFICSPAEAAHAGVFYPVPVPRALRYPLTACGNRELEKLNAPLIPQFLSGGWEPCDTEQFSSPVPTLQCRELYNRCHTAPFTPQEVINKILPYSGKDTYWQISSPVAEQFKDDDIRKDASLIRVYQTRDGVTSLMYNLDQKWPGALVGGVRVMYDDYIVYRYADIVLLKAEAKNALGQDPSAEMNLIRRRAYGANFEANRFVSGTQEANDEAILQERLFELIHEGKRWWDLVRFNKALEKVPALAGKTQNDLIFPLGEDILSLEPLVKQNPGYE